MNYDYSRVAIVHYYKGGGYFVINYGRFGPWARTARWWRITDGRHPRRVLEGLGLELTPRMIAEGAGSQLSLL